MSSNISGINWGPWSQLPNGQWHREGQDASGAWYQEDQDDDPGLDVPRHLPSMGEVTQTLDTMSFEESSGAYPYQGQGVDYGGYGRVPADNYQGAATTENYPRSSETGSRHKGKNKYTENPDHYDSGARASDRAKGSRSSKGDVKGHGHPSSRSHGKSSRSSRTDAKGKSREIEGQSGTGSSSRHIRSQDDDPDNPPPGGKHSRLGVEETSQQLPSGYPSMPLQNVNELDEEYSQSLPQNVGDVYSMGPPIAGSSSAGGYYAPPEPDDEFDEVSELPGPATFSQPRSRAKSGPAVPYDEDFTRYVVEKSRKFTFGTVFKCMWSEPMGNSRLSKHNKDPVGVGTSISEFGQRTIGSTTLYEGIRRFIVIDGTENGARNGNSICVPIATYKKQGCTKHGVKPNCHGVIYTHDRTPMLLNGEPDLGVPPIRLVVNRDLQGLERLAPESRINYSKHVTIEHNSVVHIIGQVHQDDLDTLAAGVDDNWEKRVRDRKKDKKQERHKGSK